MQKMSLTMSIFKQSPAQALHSSLKSEYKAYGIKIARAILECRAHGVKLELVILECSAYGSNWHMSFWIVEHME
jgi:hypothetical protein